MDTKAKVLDIAMNLNRVGNWAADDYAGKRERIITFLLGTSDYIKELDQSSLPSSFAGTFDKFINQYPILQKEGVNGPKNPIFWAESMITWGNILTHRSKLLT